ncbi:hypothetical protein JCM8202_003538 [Rhodotorula sphaerocarpa]
MAPRAFASQRRQPTAAAASSDSDDAQASRNAHKRQKQTHKRGSKQQEQERDPELEGLELGDPDKTCRHLFLQTLMSRKVVPLDAARELYRHCCRLCKVPQPETFETFVLRLEPGMSLCGLDIKQTRDQVSGTSYVAIVNTIEDDVAKMATDYKAEEIAFFRAVVDKIMTARQLAYSTTQTEAVRCAKAPVTKAMAIQLLKSFLAKGWLTLQSSGHLTLSPRSLLELAPYLRETFSQGIQPGDEDGPEHERDRIVVDCNLCLLMVTSGYACPNKDCGVRLHTYCVAQRLGNDGRCPDHLDESKASPCQQIWPRDLTTRKFYGVPIGVAALEENNVDSGDDDDSGDDEE